MSSRKDFEAWGCSDRDLSITLKCETYAGIAWLAWQAATKSMEAKCAALAAENAGLKESRQRLAEFIHEELDADYPLNMDIKTPAADAYRAEVRAQGVEMFGQYHNFSEKLFIQKEAKKFAAQLRKGVQS